MNRASFTLYPTKPATGWARLFGPEHTSLFLQEFLDSSLGHRTGRSHRDLFDVVGVEIELWADLLVNAPRHDFPPPLSHATDLSRIHQRRLTERHDMSLLGLRQTRELGNLA
jgi:hypothetical protein